MTDSTPGGFAALDLPPYLLQALNDVGYETPSPIQAEAIPLVMSGLDVIGQAQTGTGKTAAFALPLLAEIDLEARKPAVLVLAPTRELAIQVAEAFQRYATHMQGFHVLPLYGGENYSGQMRALKRGVHVVVGTPGRVMDHMRRGTLDLSELQTLVLDEADEMLRMGFIDDVEWILTQTPKDRQTVLFSATMPAAIKRIAERYLLEPRSVRIKDKTTTATTIRQQAWMVSGLHKLDALTRILETRDYGGVIVFVRTKQATEELAEKLAARGYAAGALNGDMPQNARERTVNQLKKGQLDIVVATDVAARGLDVERIGLVVNYDIPYDTEAYVHRIGRTGRAGKAGEAILFVAPRERRLLRAIERATGQSIELMSLPSVSDVNASRISRFKEKIREAAEDKESLALYRSIIEELVGAEEMAVEDIAAALAKLYQGKVPLLLKESEKSSLQENRKEKRAGKNSEKRNSPARSRRARGPEEVPEPEAGMETWQIEVGHRHEVSPKHIVGAIANEADISSQYIGAIRIYDDHTLVDLPEGMPDEVMRILQKARVCGRPMKMHRPGSAVPKVAERNGPRPGQKPARKSRQRTAGKRSSGTLRLR